MMMSPDPVRSSPPVTFTDVRRIALTTWSRVMPYWRKVSSLSST